MFRRLSLTCLVALAALTMWVAPVVAVELPTPALTSAAVDPVDADVALFNPNIYSVDAAGKPTHVAKSPFLEPASDVARRVTDVTWFSALVFLPFLVLPLLLLLFVIFKFRDTGDGRKPATFTGHHRLEIVWTLIPCVALGIVSLPTWFVLDWMEAPPSERLEQMTLTVTGKKFAWDYAYKGFYKNPKAEEKQEITVGQFQVIQEPIVLAKGLTVRLNMTSDDVNHAWWIPAFGVKKDCIKGRFTYVWFTPDTLGVYKGQCAELCGANHGLMIITAVVVERPAFDRFIALQQVKDDTLKVWSAIQPPAGTAIDEKALRDAVAGFLAKGRSAERQYALRYWIACNYSSLERVPPSKGVTIAEVFGAAKGGGASEIRTAIASRRAKVDALIKDLVAAAPSADRGSAAQDQTIVAGAQP